MRKLKLDNPEQLFEDSYMPVTEAGCWLWIKSVAGNGYGVMFVDGRKTYAHRYSYKLHIGPIPKGMCVLHKCDVPGCVNPAHLFLGTHKDNTQDMIKKGRSGCAGIVGESNPTAKLTEDIAIKIKKAFGTHQKISAKYGVSRRQVGRIKSGVRWPHLV